MVSSTRSKRWRQPDTSQGIGRLRFDGNKKILVRAGEQPIDGALVPRSNAPTQAIVSTIKTLDGKLLTRLDPVHLPEFCWQNNLALGRDGRLPGKCDIVLTYPGVEELSGTIPHSFRHCASAYGRSWNPGR